MVFILFGIILFPFLRGLRPVKEDQPKRENQSILQPAEVPLEKSLVNPVPVTKAENNEPVHPEKVQSMEVETADVDLEVYFKNFNKDNSRQSALTAVMEMWGESNSIRPYLNELADDEKFFNLAAKQNGFLIYASNTDMDLVRKLNLPAVIQLHMPEEPSFFYMAVCRIEGGEITLKQEAKEKGVGIKMGALSPFLGGKVFIPWKNFYDYSGMISLGSATDAILTLKTHLRKIGFDELDPRPVYDKKTEEVVRHLQKKHGIREDGLVGPLTKIILYNELKSLNVPKIRD